jgi:sterol desaturase/sphingolipid hydroxylase (fatty acid hydroxylase superfamily)
MELSKAGYYADLLLYPSLIVGLGAREMIFGHAFPFVWLCSMTLGLLTWTIVEYGVHRFVLHSIGSVARLHELHHATPGAYVGTPTWLSLLSFGLGGFVPLLILFGLEVASGATMGLMFGYLWYLLIHDVVHRQHPKHSSLLYRAKIHHTRHHYAKVPGNFGVTSSFWDRCFSTHIVSENAVAAQLTVPK